MKKLLLLGGSTQQIPAIKYANKSGYYTILCDYLSDNPGQNYSKKYYCVSTTDREAVLDIAREEKVQGIVRMLLTQRLQLPLMLLISLDFQLILINQ